MMQRRTPTLSDILLVVAFFTLTLLALHQRSSDMDSLAPPAGATIYADLARSFANGRADVPQRPGSSDSSLAVIDPRSEYAIHRDKAYVAAGPYPAIAIYLPYSVVGSGSPSDVIIAFALRAMTSILSVLLIIRTCGFYWRTYPWIIRTLIISVVACGGLGLSLSTRPSSWQIALLWSQACFSGALLFMSRACDSPRASRRTLLTMGIFAGAAAGGLPSYILLTAVVLIPFAIHLSSDDRYSFEDLIAATMPVLWSLTFLGYYNYVRFGDWRDGGLGHVPTLSGSLISALTPTFWTHLKQYLIGFPLGPSMPERLWSALFTLGNREEPIGALLASPIILLPVLFGILLILRRAFLAVPKEDENLRFPLRIAVPLGVAALVNASLFCLPAQSVWWGVAAIDQPLIVLAALSWLFALLIVRRESGWRAILNTVGALSAVATIAASVVVLIEHWH